MEDSSHELIDQLIAQEKYCYGFDALPSLSEQSSGQYFMQQPKLNITDEHKNTMPHQMSKVNLPVKNEKVITNTVINKETEEADASTHKKRWTAEEDGRLAEGIKKHGYGHWKLIAEHVQTRNAMQCKSRARQKPELQKFSDNSNQQNTKGPFTEEVIRLPNPFDHMPKSNGLLPPLQMLQSSLPINSHSPFEPIHVNPSPVSHLESPLSTRVLYDTTVPPISNGFMQSPMIPQNSPNSSTEISFNGKRESSPDNKLQEQEKDEEDTQKEVEVELNLNEVTEHERKGNAEWFMGKPAKTPERYMRIRNHIIQCWKNSRPNYLTKTAGRRNMKDCGDVNAVGRIHAYLENNNIINVNCVTPVAVKKRSYARANRSSEDGPSSSKKSKKAPGYYWADVDSDDEGNLMDVARNNIINGEGTSRPRRAVKKPETFYNESLNDSGFMDDAFRLIPVSYYPKASYAPFSVTITSDALIVMEFHSHLASAEIIGLLGGRFVQDEATKTKELQVEYVFPCRSTSTGTQCEMDPDSEMVAREVFEKKGLKVVGWYHSHPTFDPEPSIRDIENQASYQCLFRDEANGVEPFIGTIITPYNANISEKSQFQFFHVGKQRSPNKAYRLPFACFQKVAQCKQVSSDVLDICKDLLIQYKTYDKKIDMKSKYGAMTRLEKLLRSLKGHLFMSTEENTNFLLTLSRMIHTLYMGQNEDNASTNKSSQENNENVINSLTI
ncbi:uncharacterized protein B0P05DRAFT_536897 [Gilbertella persicaria]|uniref:Myb-like, SWIRM and MPN domains 1 n=1 Tax=Rhizopus stolonifer TaxID=4846 RepID=A0A367KRU5_RHIST|nr:uncharacterized protein B0P05DRAFT_536897 [Gilbertella persicaria]KAI8083316.1 hypothetical protein B0P05DRAFT_536897 [Gilbertella persicaria]RCI04928.1 Myb-like, SWIRM and MPN domains 1 [Rhizopus stolonifer]